MKPVLCALAVLMFPDVPIASAVNVCAKPPASSVMLKVLKPTAKVLLECLGDVLILHKVNATFLTKLVTVVCENHAECFHDLLDIKDMRERRGIARERMLKKLTTIFPTLESARGGEGIEFIKKMMICLLGSPELEFEDDDVTNAVMHWLYEVLRTDP